MRCLIPLIILACHALMPWPAHAAFYYCNKGDMPIEGAIGYREKIKWVSEGWWRIEPTQCAKVVGKPLKGRFYYYFARSISLEEPVEWGGQYVFCIDDKPFKIEGDGECEPRDLSSAGFGAIDVEDEQDFYLDFK